MLQKLKENHQQAYRMKFYTYKNISERVLEEGDLVYLKLQSYRQSLVEVRKNFKLSVKY